jgi:hypothetical protein
VTEGLRIISAAGENRISSRMVPCPGKKAFASPKKAVAPLF